MKRRIGIDPSIADIGLKLGIVVAAYFFVVKPILEKLGIQKTSEEKKQDDVVKKGREKFVDDAIANPISNQYNKGKATLPEGNYALIADQIYEDLNYSILSQNRADAFDQMLKMKNDQDIALLVKFYGNRTLHKFGIPDGNPRNLSSTITKELKASSVALLRDFYKRARMKFTL